MVSQTDFERFAAWRRCHDLAVAVYELRPTLPPQAHGDVVTRIEQYAFSAAASVTEALTRAGSGSARQYLITGLSALSELRYALILARDLGLLTSGKWEELDCLRRRAGYLTLRIRDLLDRSGLHGISSTR